LSRAEYVLGRACVILFLLSLITWIPGLLLFGIEASLSGASWAWTNKSFAVGIVLGSWLWISVLALVALALSAWVRWKLVAGAMVLGVMFVNSGFANAVNAVMRTELGKVVR
jgi:ABC-2 type transport system permease protein